MTLKCFGWKFGNKTRNILIVYAMIFTFGLYILFIDYVFVNNQIIIFEKNLHFINAPNYGLIRGESQPTAYLFKKQKSVRLLCLILTESIHHKTKAASVFSTWAKRCDKVVFVSEKEDDSLPVMKVNVTGRANLWGKTKTALVKAYREYGAHVDWVLKADHDTFIIMENLKEFLRPFNSSQALFAGSLYLCRSEISDCKEDGIEDKNDEIFMTGGAGYVLSKEAARRFAFGNSSESCRGGDAGAEDVELSRCLNRLGVDFIDTRDKYGRNRFFHFSPEDALTLLGPRMELRSDLNWMFLYQLVPYLSGDDCCSSKTISFHHLTEEQILMMEFLLYRLRPHKYGDEDVNVPAEQAIIPNRILDDSDTLEIVMKIKNESLKTAVLNSKTIDNKLASEIDYYLTNFKNLSLKVGMLVFLKFELTKPLPRRLYRILEIRGDSYLSSDLVWLLLTNNSEGGPCKAEYGEVVPLPDLAKEINESIDETMYNETESLHLDILETCQDRFQKELQGQETVETVAVEISSK